MVKKKKKGTQNTEKALKQALNLTLEKNKAYQMYVKLSA